MDENFAKLYHSNTQDAWFFKSPLAIHSIIDFPNLNKELDVNFEIGLLGCDNAIADRLRKSGYKIINQPIQYKIMHYDIAKGKNSNNFLEKHNEYINNSEKPKNTHPEKIGSYLVPNYDQLLNNNKNIDLFAFINNNIGTLTNWEKYKIISELLNNRITINNPD